MLKYIVIHPADNVAVALQPLEEGESITCGSMAVKVREQVPAGHKSLARPILPPDRTLSSMAAPSGMPRKR